MNQENIEISDVFERLTAAIEELREILLIRLQGLGSIKDRELQPEERKKRKRKKGGSGGGNQQESQEKNFVDEFDKFYNTFPKRVARGAARKAWVRALKQADSGVIIAGAAHYAAECVGRDRVYIAHPATWLNGERWKDEQTDETPDQDALRSRIEKMKRWRAEANNRFDTARAKELTLTIERDERILSALENA